MNVNKLGRRSHFFASLQRRFRKMLKSPDEGGKPKNKNVTEAFL